MMNNSVLIREQLLSAFNYPHWLSQHSVLITVNAAFQSTLLERVLGLFW